MAKAEEQVIPVALEAEQSVLGSMLIGGSIATAEAREILTAEDFRRPSHQAIFRAVCRLVDSEKPVDLITVSNELRDRKQLDLIGGIETLTGLFDFVPTYHHCAHYAKIVRDKSIRRKLIDAAEELRRRASDETLDTDDVLSTATQSLLNISANHENADTLDWGDLVNAAYESIKAKKDRGPRIEGPTFGIGGLDQRLWGLQPGSLTYIGARPAQGKTSLLLKLLRQNKNVPAAIFSIEMTAAQLVERLLIMESGVDSMRVRSGQIDFEQQAKIHDAANALYPLSIFAHDKSVDIAKLRAKATRWKASRDIGLILVDYIGLIDFSGKAGSREQEVAQISRGLKKLAMDLNIPIVCAVQLSRSSEREGDGKPSLRHLKDSGAQEADCDSAVLIHNPHNHDESGESRGQDVVDAELILKKNRHGPVGEVVCKWRKSTMEFYDVETRQEEVEPPRWAR